MEKLGSCFRKAKSLFEGDSILGTSFNIVNGIIGAGVLFIPFILRDMGIVIGILFMFFGILIVVSFNMILYSALNAAREKDPQNTPESLEMLMKISFEGKVSSAVAFLLSKLFVFVFLSGVIISYQIILQVLMMDILHLLTGNEWFESTNLQCRVIVGGCVILSSCVFSLVKKMRTLGIISFVSITVVLIFFLLMFILYFSGFTDPMRSGEVTFFPEFSSDYRTYVKIAKYGGVLSFASLNLALCKIHSEYSKENIYKIPATIFLSFGSVFILYVTISLVGYLSFLENTDPNIILSYQGTELYQRVISIFLRLLTFAQVFLTYPVLSFVLAQVAFESVDLAIKLVSITFLKSKERKEEGGKNDDVVVEDEETQSSEITTTGSSDGGGLSSEIVSDALEDFKVKEDIENRFGDLYRGQGSYKGKRTSLNSIPSSFGLTSRLSRDGDAHLPSSFDVNDEEKNLSWLYRIGIDRRYILFTSVSLFDTILFGFIAILYPNASKLVGYVGGIPGIVFSIVIPTIAYIKLVKYSTVWGGFIILFAVFSAVCLGLGSNAIQILEEFGVLELN